MEPEDEEDYRHAASHALAGFQLIEVGLKEYIANYHKIVREYLPEAMVYEYGRKDVEEASLGKLVHIFAKINGNASLIQKLRKLQPQRDLLAHRAFTELYGSKKKTFDFLVQTQRLHNLADNLTDILDTLNGELMTLIAQRSPT